MGRENRTCTLGPFYTITTDELRILVENSRNPPDPEPDEEAESTDPE
jgi:hypothetical protein